jgi:chromosome partitioning protein
MYNPRNTHDNDALDALRQEIPLGVHFFDPINRSTSFDKSAAEGVATLATHPNAPGVLNYYQVADHLIAYASQK